MKIADLPELPPGTGKLVVGPLDKPIALFNVGGQFFAINAVFPHRGEPLSQGTLSGPVVTCP